MESDRQTITVTPAAAEHVFAAMYQLTSIPYIDGVTFQDDPRGKDRALKALEKTKMYCDKAIHVLSEDG